MDIDPSLVNLSLISFPFHAMHLPFPHETIILKCVLTILLIQKYIYFYICVIYEQNVI